ncbi:O-antigen/teichoic acid export membrane protein [Scopulibacillus daqui]|uniref:O-antigen/teichoic acid export membrane protein n=1 Tax=Scopulibacillus daqui TaxID=1469162 RepID=A0ABS2Q2I4_9BACL|nr:polysaccharide biosynthesis protein [Scopulibacillus daqui]MBM7646494.1 O-antigen/teichoic acid export membrane protein [Scopulibacillus daqui]
MLRGTFILTVATFLSKFLGLIFVVPFNALVGSSGTALYSFGYTPYAIILSLSTMGVPLAVSKFVSRYNAMGDYLTGRRLFRSGLKFMTITGILGFLILYFMAPFIARLSSIEGSDYSDVTTVIRVTSVALIIVPAMSLIRGYFQGFQSMGPTALSQVIEQLVRTIFILVSAFLVIVVFQGSVTTAVALATFASFVGAVFGLLVLIRYWQKRKAQLDAYVEQSTVKSNLSLSEMYRELIAYAIPFVAVGIAMNLYQAIDQFTQRFFSIFHHYTYNELVSIMGNLLMNDQKLVMIPVSLATALALSVVPAVTKSFAEGNRDEVQRKTTQALQLVLYLTIPAAAGMSILGYTIYGMLYDFKEIVIGGYILRWYAPTAILFALFSVTASILQGINWQKVTIFSLLVGVLIKLILNPLFIMWFGMAGPILATNIGYIASVAINMMAITRATGYEYSFIIKRFLLISIFTIVMLIVVKLILLLSGGTIPNSRWHATFVSIIAVIFGGGVYGVLSFRSGLARQVLGRRVPLVGRFMK